MYNHEPKEYACPMCQRVAGSGNKFAAPSDIVFQDKVVTAFISPKWWVNNPGHVIVIPNTHVENLYDISDEDLASVSRVVRRVAVAIKCGYECDGVSTRQHNEPAGNQDVWHYHVHVFPRYSGDDLYINHKQQEWVDDASKRKKYADKIRKYI